MGKTERQLSAVMNFLKKIEVSKIQGINLDKIKNYCLWAMLQNEMLGDSVLVPACAEGILTCFIASVNPDKTFIGFDDDAELIKRANEMKEQLQLANVVFETADITDYSKPCDSVLSFGTIDTYVGPYGSGLRFRKFADQVNGYADFYSGYAQVLSGLVKDGGTYVAIEDIDMGTQMYGLLSAFCDAGMTFAQEKLDVAEYVDSASQSKIGRASMVLIKKQESKEELFVKWAKDQLGDKMTPAKADYILFTSAGKLIEGYSAYRKGEQVVLSGIYENKDDADSIFMYRASAKGKNVLRYPKHRLSEAKLTLSRDKEIDKKDGLSVLDFGVDSPIRKN